EPSGRDTFPAIALSVIYLLEMEKIQREEVVCFCPVDLNIETAFLQNLTRAERLLQKEDIELVLIGIHPTHPSEKYGYIVPEEGEQGHHFLRVHSFVEKPDEERA